MPARKKQTEEVELLLSRFQPGDTAVLQSRVMLTTDQMRALSYQFKSMMPDVKVVVLNAKARVLIAQSAEINNTELDTDE